MKSSFLEKSKRALVLLLTGAMIATSVPSTAFAATVADDDVIIEEATDAVAEDAVVEEEVVADEPSDVVEALGAEEPVDGESDTIDADMAVVEDSSNFRTIGMTVNNSDEAVAAGALAGNYSPAAVAAFGNTFVTQTYMARSLYTDTKYRKYTNVSWKLTDKAEGKENSLPAGMTGVDNDDGTFTISGTPTEYVNAKVYVLELTDKDTSTNSAGKPVVADPKKIEITITTAASGIAPMYKAGDVSVAPATAAADKFAAVNYVSATNYKIINRNGAASDYAATTNEITPLVISAKTGTNSVTAGYTVNADESGMTEKEKDNNVVPLVFVMNNSIASAASAVKDLEVKLAGADKDKFDLTVADGDLYSNTINTKTITVAPKAGIPAKSTDGGVYSANIEITSKSIGYTDHKITAYFTFKVDRDLTFSVAKAGKTSDLKSSDTTFSLGSVKVGEEFPTTVVTITGGYGALSCTDIAATNIPKGLTITPVGRPDATGSATFTISGTPEAGAFPENTVAPKAYTIPIGVSDDNGITRSVNFTLNVNPADLTYLTSKEENVETAYAWGAATGYTAAKGKAVFNVTNNGTKPVTIKGAITGISVTGTNSASVAGDELAVTESVTVNGGETKAITITPKSGLTDTTDGVVTATLTLSGDGIATKTVGLTFNVTNAATVTITKPDLTGSDDGTTTGKSKAIDRFTVGKNRTYRFEAVGTAVTSSCKWWISDADLAKLEAVGLEFDAKAGTISGTATKVATIDDVLLKLLDGSGTDITAGGRYIDIPIVADANGLEAYDSASNKIGVSLKVEGVGTTKAGEKDVVITIKNKTTQDIKKIQVKSIKCAASGWPVADTRITAGTELLNVNDPANTGKPFLVKYATDTAKSFDLKAGESASFTIRTNELKKTAGNLSDDYNPTIVVGSADTDVKVGDVTFALSMEVAEAPMVGLYKDASYDVQNNYAAASDIITSNTSYRFANDLVLGKAVVNTTTKATEYCEGKLSKKDTHTFVAYANSAITAGNAIDPSDGKTIFTWAKSASALASDPDIATSGLELDDEGFIYGTPVVAGLFPVTVTAYDVTNKISGSADFLIKVNGTATIALTSAVATLNAGTEYIFEGALTNETPTASLQVTVTAGGSDINNGLDINVEDVDIRSAADVTANKPNTTLGSTTAFTVTPSKITEKIAKNQSATFTIKPNKMTKAGRYVIKVTVSGNEITESKSFYVQHNVTDPLSIDQKITGTQGSVGNNYRLELTSQGASINQTYSWMEVQSKVQKADGTYEYANYLTTQKTADNDGTAVGIRSNDTSDSLAVTQTNGGTSKTGLLLTADDVDNTSATDLLDGEVWEKESQARAWIGGSTHRSKAVPTTAGDFNVGIKLKTAKYPISVGAKIAGDEDNPYVNGANIGILAAANNVESAYKEQEATQTIALKFTKNNQVNVTNLTSSKKAASAQTIATKGKAMPTDEKAVYDRVAGTVKSDGFVFNTITGYEFEKAVVGYAQESATIKVDNISLVALSNLDVSLTTENFEITAPTKANGKYTISTLAATNGTTDVVVRPKANLAAGTYEDTLTISHDSITPITFNLKFVVEDEHYYVSAFKEVVTKTADDYSKDYPEGDTDKDDVLIIENNENKADFVLNPLVVDGDNPNNRLVFANTGNKADVINSVIEVADANGTPINDAANKKLIVTTAINNTTIAVNKYDHLVVTTLQAANSSLETPGTYNAFVKVTYKKNSAGASGSFIIPVTYTVAAKVNPSSITVDPASVTFAESVEQYTASSLAKNITVTNNNTDTTEKGKLYNTKAELTGTGKADFELSATDEELAKTVALNKLSLGGVTLASNGSMSFTVTPKAGLSAGKHTARIKIDADNLSGSKYIDLTFNVKKNNSLFVQDIKTVAPTTTTIDLGYAKRLYNALVIAPNYAGAKSYSTGKIVKTLTDADDSSELVVEFTVTTSATLADDAALDATNAAKVTDITAVTVTRNTTAPYTKSSYTTNVTGAQIENCTAAKHALVTTPADVAAGTPALYEAFSKITFNTFATVAFVLDDTTKPIGSTSTRTVDTKIVEKVADLKGDNIVITATNEGKENEDITKIVATVATGTAIKTVMPKLPTLKKTTGSAQGFEGWVSADGLTQIDENTIVKAEIGDATVTTNMTATMLRSAWHTHTYPASDSGEGEFIKWRWQGSDAAGYTGAILDLYCTKANCADRENSKISIDAAVVLTDAPADYEHGAHKEYKATVTKAASLAKGGPNVQFTDAKVLNETGSPLGHTWGYKVKSVVKSEDGKSYVPTIIAYETQDSANEKYQYTYKAAEITITTEDNPKATFEKKGVRTWKATFNELDPSTDAKTGAKTSTTKTLDIATEETPILEHDYQIGVTSVDPETLVATIKITDTNDPECNVTVTPTATKVSEDEEYITYSIVVTLPDNTVKTITHKELKVAYTWSYSKVEFTKSANGLTRTGATFFYTGKATGHDDVTKEIPADTFNAEDVSTREGKENIFEYTATITAANASDKQARTEKIMIDTTTGEEYVAHSDHEWTASVSWDETFDFDDPTVVITYTCKYGETKTETVEVSKKSIVRKGNTFYELTLNTTDPSGKPVKDTKYVDSTGKYVDKSAIGPENPEFEATQVWNLFYTNDYEFEVDSNVDITGATFTGAGITKGFFSVTNDAGTVTVKVADTSKRKAAAKEANTTFEAPAKWTVDGEEVAGIYTITIPVEYTKPNLKLSSTSANFFTTATSPKTQTVGTSILVQNKDGVYQSMNLDDYNIDIENSAQFVHSGGLKVNKDASETEYGYVAFDATGKASGKIGIQGENWAEKVQLAYNVKEQKKHTLTVGGKTSYTVTLNSKAPGVFSSIAPAIDGVYTSTMDDLSAEELEKLITITPKKAGGPNVFFNGDGLVIVRNDKENEDGTVSPIVAKGSFSYDLVDSNGSKAKLNVKVVDTDLSKSITLKVNQQMNVITGQDMVVTPTIKNFNGYIKSVEIDGTDSNFDVVYNGSIVVKAKEGAKVNTKDKYTLPLKVTVGDFDDEFEITGVSIKNFKIKATTPTLKAQKATFTKQGDNLSINFTSTYKNGAKHLVKIDPDKLVQADTKGNKDNFVALTYEDGDQKGNIIINEDGTFTAKSVSGKAKAFKVTATYNFRNSDGEVLDGSVTKTVSVGTKIKK